jgi:hypothetical protein
MKVTVSPGALDLQIWLLRISLFWGLGKVVFVV